MKTATKIDNDRKGHQPVIGDGTYQNLATEVIDFSPFNYRKHFQKEDLEKFAEELKLHGIISPLTVRKMENGRFELVAGERRLRAARIAKIYFVPVVIKELTNEQVTEIQLAENLQRENPHPLDEAQAVKLMQETGKNIEEIALRLGKSKQFVYIRLKLLNLIEPFHEMFYINRMTLQQALEIATISADAQAEFFNEHCTKWKQKNFELDNLDWYLRQYKYDLRNAPFDVKDKKLVPEVGACTGCPFNSATIKTLFPELAKQAICSNTSCYKNKCVVNLRSGMINALSIHEPVAMLFNGEPSEPILEFLKTIPEAQALPRHDYNKVTILQNPEEPEREDFTYEDDDEGERFDKKEFDSAMREYKDEVKAFEKEIRNEKNQKALLEKKGEFYPVYFNLDPPRKNAFESNGKPASMKQVQEAIKAGTATTDLLDEAITGVKQREERAKELDKDKIQKSVHEQLVESCDLSKIKSLTKADLIAVRLLVYQSLDFNSRQKVQDQLFKKVTGYGRAANEKFCTILDGLSNQQFSFMIRLALIGKSDSKFPNSETGITLYKVAEAAGIDVKKIDTEQKSKADARGERTKERIKDLNIRKTKLSSSKK